MIYYLYQITNLVNGKIYIGVHRTNNLDDGYMGSGKNIQAAIKKYGLDHFRKDILEYFDSLDDMFLREAEIVNKDFLLREDVYNIVEGGSGRFPEDATWKALASKTPEKLKEISSLGNIAKKHKYPSGQAPATLEYSRSSRNLERLRESSKLASTPEAVAKKKETFKRIKHSQGEKNSQFGTMWITNGVENKKIRREDPIPDGWRKGRKLGIEK